MSAKQNGPGSPEQALFLHSVMLKVGLQGGRLTTSPGRAVGRRQSRSRWGRSTARPSLTAPRMGGSGAVPIIS